MTATLGALDDLTFDAAAHLVLSYLRDHVPLALWSVTRVENDQQVYLYLGENGYGLEEGYSMPWEDSLCFQMAAGRAPAVSPDVQAVPEYVASLAKTGFDVRTYAGTTISAPDGALFGAICGFDPAVSSSDSPLLELGPQLQLLGRLMSMVLAADRRRDQYATALMRVQLEAETDALTGVMNRNAWERITAVEETRLHRYAEPLVAVVLDLDRLKQVNDTRGHAAGDAYIRAAAHALRRAVRESDVVARIGGDEFAALLLGCGEAEAGGVIERIHRELERAGVSASVGSALIESVRGVQAAVGDADAQMYAVKAERRARPEPSTRLDRSDH